jgi:hypothetical protein
MGHGGRKGVEGRRGWKEGLEGQEELEGRRGWRAGGAGGPEGWKGGMRTCDGKDGPLDTDEAEGIGGPK